VSLFDVFVGGKFPHPGAQICVTKHLDSLRQAIVKISWSYLAPDVPYW